MRPWFAAALFAGGLLVGCMAGGPATTAQPPSPAPHPAVSERASAAGSPDLLVLDRTDLRIGLTVQYRRVPDVTEIADLRGTPGLAHVVLSLPAWPATYEEVQSLAQLPPEADAIVVLPGYPPSREAVEAWNLVQARLRIVLVVPSTPPSPSVLADLNVMRGLERVVADVDFSSRGSFERLQRPLSFRRVVD